VDVVLPGPPGVGLPSGVGLAEYAVVKDGNTPYLYKLVQLTQVGLPQALGITASPTFVGLTLSGFTSSAVGIVVSGTNGQLARVGIGAGLSIVNGALVASGSAGTNLSYDPSTRLLSSSTGDDVTLPLATTLAAGLQSSADKAKLDSITVDAATKTIERVRNTTGVEIPKGAVLRIPSPGSSGTTLLVALADASDEATAANTYGLAQDAIPHNSDGIAITSGDLDGLNTDHLVEGGLVYLSEIAGQTTSTRPTQPAHGVILGWCKKKGPGTSGILSIKIANGQELDELHDVLITGNPPSVGAPRPVLARHSDGLWRNTLITPADVGGVSSSDARLSDAREWSAATVDQAEAEARTGTTRRAWTAERVGQAIAAWWTATTSAVGRAVATAADQAAARTAIGAGTSNLALGSATPANLAGTASAGSGSTAAPIDHAHQRDTTLVVIALSGASSDPVAAQTVDRWIPTVGGTIIGAALDCETAVSGAAFIVNTRLNSSSIFSTKPQINVGGTTASNTPVLSTTTFSAGDVFRFDIDQASGGARLAKLTLTIRRSS
jgi:hypothetical protein